MARITCHVVPRSSRAGPDGRHDGIPRLRLVSPPADGKANAEAERLLTDLLGAKATLVTGATSRRKTFEIALDEAEVARRVHDAFGDV